MARRRTDRVSRWKEAVYLRRDPIPKMRDDGTPKLDANGNPETFKMSDGCRLFLLTLAGHMNVDGVVSVPRTQLAKQMHRADARITEYVAIAKAHGFLSVVRRPRPGVTAVYQATIPPPPHSVLEVRQTGPDRGTDPVPLQADQGYRRGGSQVVVPAERIETAPPQQHPDVGSNEKRHGPDASHPANGCQHDPALCTEACIVLAAALHPDHDQEASA